MQQSDICNYSYTYIFLKEQLLLQEKIHSMFRTMFHSLVVCQLTTDNAENLDFVMPLCSLIEYIKNYRKTTGSLRDDYNDESNKPLADNYNADPITNSASFK